MVRTAPNPIDNDGAQAAARSGWLSALLRTLFVRPVRSKRVDGRRAVKPGMVDAIGTHERRVKRLETSRHDLK